MHRGQAKRNKAFSKSLNRTVLYSTVVECGGRALLISIPCLFNAFSIDIVVKKKR